MRTLKTLADIQDSAMNHLETTTGKSHDEVMGDLKHINAAMFRAANACASTLGYDLDLSVSEEGQDGEADTLRINGTGSALLTWLACSRAGSHIQQYPRYMIAEMQDADDPLGGLLAMLGMPEDDSDDDDENY